VEAISATATGTVLANCIVAIGSDGSLKVECSDALLRFGLVPNLRPAAAPTQAPAPTTPTQAQS